ncbi:VOC family protein [Marinomonas aquiplantarum]|uniref:Glyoxalase/bleomycin resistance protein/dioxygenase superfamily protein n=1 Tax=Marinomonas aquiplantarum TaxID=491951 RepID=A0A366CX23_9GAMM|nr:VOC family protein [Marinomonas aquiplantarum]RBO82380.1 glyoxalase/bleomycin resistance protein/dioxygenase superfamily protein [Marinomonas aquiplantarum]
MTNLKTVELKAFVPSKDFELSKSFYHDLGFEMPWSSDELAYFHTGNTSFLLQNYYVQELADNFMMHLLVEDLDSWWKHIFEKNIAEKYSIKTVPPQDQPWGMRDFVLIDPSGILWRIGQNSEKT